MTPNEAVNLVKAACEKHPPLQADLTAAWNRVCDQIEARAKSARPKRKVFEVHHETQSAREALLMAVAAGRGPESAEIEALERVGLR